MQKFNLDRTGVKVGDTKASERAPNSMYELFGMDTHEATAPVARRRGRREVSKIKEEVASINFEWTKPRAGGGVSWVVAILG